MWEARARYEDGSEYEATYPSTAKNHKEEIVEQQKLEAMLVSRHRGCIWYSVNWISESDYI